MVHRNEELIGRLTSFDPDIRYMGLNDISATVDTDGVAVLETRLVTHIIACLVDSSPDLQNMVAKLVNKLAASSVELASQMFWEIVAQHTSNAVKGMALKNLFRTGNLPTELLKNPLQDLISKDPLFSTIDGVDAVLELVRIRKLPVSTTDHLTAFMMNLLSNPPAHLNVYMPVLEVLAILVPHCSKLLFETQVKQELIAKIDRLTHMNLVGKLVPRVPSDWLCPEVPRLIIEQLRLQQHEVPLLEAALKTLAAFTPRELNSDQNEAALSLVQKFVQYREFEDEVDFNNEDSEYSAADCADSESDWFDESACVRQAACQLAVATKSGKCLDMLLNACSRELDETTRLELYHSIHLLSALDAQTQAKDLGGVFEKFASKDVQRRHLSAASRALEYKLKADGFVSPDTILALMQQKKALAYDFIPYVRSDGDRVSNTDSIRMILEQFFEDAETSADISDRSIRAAIQQAHDTRLYELVDAVEKAMTRTPSENVKFACLTSLPYLLMGVNDDRAERIVRQTLDYLESTSFTSDTAEAGTLSALKALQAFATQRPQPQFDTLYVMIMSGVGNLLVSRTERLSEAVINECCQIICGVQEAELSIAPVIFKVCDPRLIKRIEDRVMSSSSLTADRRALDWAIKNKTLRLIKLRAAIPGLFDETVSACLSESDCYEVHSAAASGVGEGWKALTDRYSMNDTSFSELKETQLQLLLDLAQHRSRWAWFSIDEIHRATQNTLQSEIFGSITAISSGNPSQDVPKFISLSENCRGVAFASYANLLQDPSTVLEIMSNYPDLQVPDAAKISVCNEIMFQKFTEKFSSNPLFVVHALEKVDFPGLWELAFPLLSSYVISMENECSLRGDALACIRWKLVREQPIPLAYLRRTLDLVMSVLVPDSKFVQTISIGPFKHKVDSLLGLRQQALETLYTCLIPNIGLLKDKQLGEITRSLVENSLNDNEYDIKLLAYELLASMAGQSLLVKNYIGPNNPAIMEDMHRTPKDSAVKDDVEKISALARAASKLQQILVD